MSYNFTGLQVTDNQNFSYTSQERYTFRLQRFNESPFYKDSCSGCAKLAWVCNTRTDICSAVEFLLQVTKKLFDNQSHKLANNVISRLKKTPSLGLRFTQLDLKSLFQLIYFHASANFHTDHRCQLAFIILLMNSSNHRCTLQYCSHKSRQITRLSLARETLALSDAFDR